MSLLLAPEQGALDHVDLLRHVLGMLIVPRTITDVYKHLERMEDTGVVLPSGRAHLEIAEPRKLLEELTNTGYAKVFSGFRTHEDLNRATSNDTDLLPHPEPRDEPHAPGAYFQTMTRGQVWAQEATSSPSDQHWIITKTGFNALTGHDWGGA